MLVSLVVPSRGGAQRLPILLHALAAQTVDDWEAVVVLDGDVDGSAGVLARVTGDLPVRAVILPENRGRATALNTGFEAAAGEVLVRCDDDLVPGPEYVARHAAAHAGDPVGVVGLVRNVFPETTYARVYGRDWDERYRREAYATPVDERWHHWGANVSVRRETWDLVGPYDTAFRAYGWEDVDWGYRLHLAGLPVVIDPGLETEHRIAATTAASRAQRAYYSGSARHRFEQKHGLATENPAPEGAWGRAVSLLAGRLDEERADTAGRWVDRASRVLPQAVARKSVALVVESAARSGHARGTRRTAI